MMDSMLAQQIAADLIGAADADSGSLDAQFGIKAGSELVSRITKFAQDKQTKERQDKADEVAAKKAVDADVAWANAETQAILLSRDPQRAMAAKALAEATAHDALAAGKGLSQGAWDKRVQAAKEQVKRAAAEAMACSAKDPTCARKQANLAAWKRVAERAVTSGAPSAELTPQQMAQLSMVHDYAEPSFLSRKYGPLPVWGWGVLGIGGVVGTILIVRALRAPHAAAR